MRKLKKIPKSVRVILSLLFWLFVWHIASEAVSKEVLLPSPRAVFAKLYELLKTADFYKTVFSSVLRITLGFAAASLLGLFFGILSSFSVLCDTLLSPLLSVIKATPVASFIILALVWMDKGLIPGAIALLMVLPVIYGNVRTGIEQTDRELLEAAKVFRLKKTKVLTKIYVPSVLPYFRAGLFTCTGLAWKAGVAAEVLCTPKISIGKMLYDSKTYLESVDLFAWTLTVIVISVVIEKLLKLLLRPSEAGKKEEKI